MDFSLVIPAFIAGILTFLAPCTLPLVPGYLGFISGTSLGDLDDSTKAKQARLNIFLNGLSFVVGFSLVFVVLGTLAGIVGTALVPYRIWLTRFGGVFVIVFGILMIVLNIFHLPFLTKEKRFKVPPVFKKGNKFYSVLLGSAFGFGWTPCVGPILGSVLILASTSSTALQGGVLLFVFSLGLAIPFLMIALGIGSMSKRLPHISRYLTIVAICGGLFLILLGFLLLFDNMSILLSYGFRLLKVIHYDKILDLL